MDWKDVKNEVPDSLREVLVTNATTKELTNPRSQDYAVAWFDGNSWVMSDGLLDVSDRAKLDCRVRSWADITPFKPKVKPSPNKNHVAELVASAHSEKGLHKALVAVYAELKVLEDKIKFHFSNGREG